MKLRGSYYLGFQLAPAVYEHKLGVYIANIYSTSYLLTTKTPSLYQQINLKLEEFLGSYN